VIAAVTESSSSSSSSPSSVAAAAARVCIKYQLLLFESEVSGLLYLFYLSINKINK